jgi:hypothetical protein
VGAKFARRRQRGGLYSRRFRLSTPYFHFSFHPDLHLIEPEFENLKLKISFVFQWLAASFAAVWRRALQR